MAASYKKVKHLTVHLSTRQNVSLFLYGGSRLKSCKRVISYLPGKFSH